jgi:hypothetical protein
MNENQILVIIDDLYDLLTFIKIFLHFQFDFYSVKEKLITHLNLINLINLINLYVLFLIIFLFMIFYF